MNLVLTDFMQTVSLKDPTNPKSYLVLRNDKGEECRVPVGADAIEALTRFAFKQEHGVPPEVENEEAIEEEKLIAYEEEDPPNEEGATTFGGDVEEGDTDPDPVRPFELPRAPEPPKSEEEIASL